MNIPHFPPQISQWIEASKHDIPPRNSNYLLALSCVLAFIRVSTDTCELSSAPGFYYTSGIRTPEKEEKEHSTLSAVKNKPVKWGHKIWHSAAEYYPPFGGLLYVPGLVLILHEWKGKAMNIPYFPPSVSQWNEAPKNDIPPLNSSHVLALSCVSLCSSWLCMYVEFREWMYTGHKTYEHSILSANGTRPENMTF